MSLQAPALPQLPVQRKHRWWEIIVGKKSFGAAAREAGTTSTGREWPPVGEYTATAVMANVGQTKSNGKPKLGIRVVVDTGAEKGKAGWVNQTLSVESDPSVEIFMRTIKGFGFEDEFFDAFDYDQGPEMVQAVADAVPGRRARIKVVMGKDPQGQARPEVKFVNPLRATDPEPEIELTVTTGPAKSDTPRPDVRVHKPGAARPTNAPKPPTGAKF